MTEDSEIKEYFPVIAPTDGSLALDLKVGNKIFVSPKEKDEEFIYPYKYNKLYLGEIVQIEKDSEGFIHFLVEIHPEEYGDVKINDEFFKIKVADSEETKKIKTKIKEEKRGNIRLIIDFCLVFLSIVAIYSLLLASISFIF